MTRHPPEPSFEETRVVGDPQAREASEAGSGLTARTPVGSGPPDNPTIRVAGLLAKDGRVLMVQQGRGDDRYWLLPGGGVCFGETLADALKRELQEELGLRVGVGRLLAIVESISPEPSYRKHVVHLVFEITASPEASPEPQVDAVLDAAYLDELALQRADVRPPIGEFFIACTRQLPSSPQYLGRRW